MKPKVFISHSSRDTWVALRIAEAIEKCGTATFLDQLHIQHGDDFEEEILKAEETCTELLVLLTPWARHRSWIYLEIGFFRRGKKRVVGVLHGLTPKELSENDGEGVLLNKLDLIELNELDSYISQLRMRAGTDVQR